MNDWSRILDSCPGLLCCVVNSRGRLIYASHGYKTIAARLFGHKCVEGGNYPPMITAFDKTFHEVLMAACLGDTNVMEFNDREKVWELTAVPLKNGAKKIDGVVIRLTSENKNPPVNNKNLPPVIQSNPEILESVPFRAGVVNSHGIFMAVNKFLSSSVKFDLIGKNLIEIIDHDTNFGLIEMISKRSGFIECKIPDLISHENFYDFSGDFYLDENLNDPVNDESEKIKNSFVRLHASPIKWSGKECVMITFEDISELNNTREQLRRLLTFDTSKGILNRRGMEHVILREFSEAVKNSSSLSLIMINIDNFSTLNENRGYMNANRILMGFVNIMKRFLAEHGENILGHWGGDEFMILAHCSGAAAVVMANDIHEKSVTLKMSAGVSDLNLGAYAGVNDFIAAAYGAMVEAKASGGKQTILAKN